MLSSGFQALIVPSSAEPSRVAEANAHNDRGVQFWQAGRRSEAVAAFTHAARSDARFAVPWHNRGAIFLMEGQFTQAVRDLAHAVELAPTWTLPRTHLAQAYLRSGEARLALAASDAARTLDPSLPDVRNEMRAVLQARAAVAARVAGRRRTYFLITLGAGILITILTAGIGFATLALPIYRFALYAEAARQRDTARRQLKELDASLASAPSPALPALPAPGALIVAAPMTYRASDAPYVSAGVLPAFSSAELDPQLPTGTRYRRSGWSLLLASLICTVSGIVAMVVSVDIPADPRNAGLEAVLEGGLLSLFGIICLVFACLTVAAAVLVGAVAAFRRRRIGWGIAILTIGVCGIFCALLPAQLMVLIYLLAMPTSPGKFALEPAPTPELIPTLKR